MAQRQNFRDRERKFKPGDVVRCISTGHPRNVPLGSVGVVKAWWGDHGFYEVEFFAHRTSDDVNVSPYMPNYYPRELEKIEHDK